MRLSKTNDRKLTQLIWRERMKRIAAVAVVAAVLGGAAVYLNYERALKADPTVNVVQVEAIVIPGVAGRPIRKGSIFHARMADGHDIDAWSANGFAPAPGARVLLGEAHHKSGKLSYDLIRTVE